VHTNETLVVLLFSCWASSVPIQ